MKAYVVLEKSWTYNDQTYDESDGGNPVRAFKSREGAEQLRNEKTADFLKGFSIRDYTEDGDPSYFFRENSGDICKLLGYDEGDDIWGEPSRTPSAEDLVNAAALIGDKFYYVKEVELAT